jgi:hypothetical protein
MNSSRPKRAGEGSEKGNHDVMSEGCLVLRKIVRLIYG